ncbi:methyltransferase [candidate division WOR-1 bacterium DG_54_3]|uniref:Methyltransferase n=1 Tax=candidate division WOR-1 bacterium DG_54_3 TaxID=1703775 RepID=A0A0S7XQY2_UNCSA|nr:MAG: methyltransferase [candidate division WOR-1 bacterium DG_54_3]
MFHNISQAVIDRMKYLENIDAKDRRDRTSPLQRLRQIPPETGKFIALLAASAPQGTYLEIGTSAGYSTLWLAVACKEVGRKITTFEVLEEKAKLAKETFRLAGVEKVVELVIGDAREYLGNYKNISFCFLDAEKEAYYDCYEKIIPNMISGGILVADNAISHKDELKAMLERALNDERVDALVVPIGRGELICRKLQESQAERVA